MRRIPWLLLALLIVVTLPIVILFTWLIVDSFSVAAVNSIWPASFTLSHWDFLFETIEGHPSIWKASVNTLIFAISTVGVVVATAVTAGYALSRLSFPFRAQLLAGTLMLHAFPSISLIVAIFLTLRLLGLYDTLAGVVLVKASLEIPFGIWVMKGFYDTVSWDIEMAGVVDGAGRFRVWWRLILPQVGPGIAALAIFSFIASWSEFVLPLVLSPSSDVALLSVYLAGLLNDDNFTDYGMLKAVGLFYIFPVMVFYLLTQDRLMQVFGGASQG
ncbi:MAG: carbohydrate ABC transporter permease [Gammaproteobacteria bacterium]|nr:carbohydrate ABC transporter permease [Gammaproteobacteria bacterium]